MRASNIIPVLPHTLILVRANAAIRPFGRNGVCVICGTPWRTRFHCNEWVHQRQVARMALLERGLLPVSSGTARKLARALCAVWVVAPASRIQPHEPIECWIDPWQVKWTTVDPSFLTNAERQRGRVMLSLAGHPLEMFVAVEKAVAGLRMLQAHHVRGIKLPDAMAARWNADVTSSADAGALSDRGRSRRPRAASRG